MLYFNSDYMEGAYPAILEKLSEEERQIVLFHLVAELKHKEIAELLELKLSTTLSKYHRALKKIRNEWGNS